MELVSDTCDSACGLLNCKKYLSAFLASLFIFLFSHFQIFLFGMLIKIKAIVPYVKKCAPLAPISTKAALKRLLRFLNVLSKKGRSQVESFYLMKKVSLSGHSKAKAEVRMTAEILKSVGGSWGFLEDLELKSAVASAKAAAKASKGLLGMASREAFRKVAVELDDTRSLFLWSLLASGRRQIDLSRASSSNFSQVSDHKFIVQIPKDKMNQEGVYFCLDYSLIPAGWTRYEPSQLGSALVTLLSKDRLGKPFSEFSSSNLSTRLKFRAHSLRAIAAIFRTLQGWDDEKIMLDIGWRDFSSLKRYRKLDRNQIVDLGSLDRVLEVVRGGQ